MKYIKSLVCLFFLVVINGCEKDGECGRTNFNLSGETLKQTVWAGTFIRHNGEEEDVTLIFESDKRVQFELTDYRSTVDYKADGNGIYIGTSSTLPRMSGTWMVVRKTKNELRLEKDIATSWHFTMILSRVYP